MNVYKQKDILFTRKGMTLIENIISLALLAIIIVPFLTMFVNSTSTNSKSQNILEATYLAQSTMEELYSLSISYPFSDGLLQLTTNGYTETVIVSDDDYNYVKEQGDYYIKIEIRNSAYTGSLVKSVVKIYNNSSMDKLVSQMETILTWND